MRAQNVGGVGLRIAELQQRGPLSLLTRWRLPAFIVRCTAEFMPACGKAQVCSGRERFNIMKPNYTWPAIALYRLIESTELAYESSHFSWVNKKSSVVIVIYLRCFFKKNLFHIWHHDRLVFRSKIFFSYFCRYFSCFASLRSCSQPRLHRLLLLKPCLPGQAANVWVAETQWRNECEAISRAAARGKGHWVKCHNSASL